MAKKVLYGLEDYAKDRYEKATPMNGVARQVAYTPTSTQTSRSLRSEGPASVPQPYRTGVKPAPAKNVAAVADVADLGETNTGVQPTGSTGEKSLTAAELTLIRHLDNMEAARENAIKVLSRKFKYDETSSPLYSILQKQYEREAEIAAGRAYAGATANTGGYGSSYATMAGEEARRQVMAGFDDMQDELYQAAWDEFQAERQSATEWYAASKEMLSDARIEVEREKLESAARATGLNEDTYNLMLQAANEGWYTGTNKEAVRARLETIAAGNPEINVDAIMNRLVGEQEATVTDAVSAFKTSPTVSGAAEIMNAAKSSGTWEQVQPEVSAGLADAYIKNMKTPDAAGSLMGVDAATWNGMSDEDRKQTILNNAGAAARDGLITADDYAKILMTDVSDMAEAIRDGEVDKPASAICDLVIDWQNYRDMGYMSEETYDKLMSDLSVSMNAPELIEKQAVTLGERAGEALDKINAPEWVQKGAEYVLDYGPGLTNVVDLNGKGINLLHGAMTANAILSNFGWYRRMIGLNDDQEKAMKELLGYYRGGR